MKAAEARQCIRCNEECAAIREQLFQIDPASASPGSTPSPSPSATMPSPLGSSPSSALESSLAPSPSTMGELSDSMRRNVERMGVRNAVVVSALPDALAPRFPAFLTAFW